MAANALQELADLSIWLKKRAEHAESNMNAMPIRTQERLVWSRETILFNDVLKEVGLRMMRIEQGVELPEMDKVYPDKLRFVLRVLPGHEQQSRILQVYEHRDGAFGWYDVPLVEDAEETG